MDNEPANCAQYPAPYLSLLRPKPGGMLFRQSVFHELLSKAKKFYFTP